MRVFEQFVGVVAATLDDVASEAVLALRREADVCHHRDTRSNDTFDLLGAANTALELDRLRSGLLHEPDGGPKRLVGPVLVGAERHVGHDEGAARPTHHGCSERDQLVEGDRDGGVVAEDGVAGRVTDEQEVDARLVEDRRRQEVVAGEPGDLDPLLLRPLEVSCPNSFE